MASEGLTLTNMSEYINHTRECVKRILSEHNIELKPSPENRSGLGFNYIIEVYGHYWHDKKEKTMKRDIIKNNYLKDNGYLVDIIWEDEIQNKKDEVKNRILTSLNKQIKQYFRSRNLVNSKMEVSDENQANGSELSD